MNVKYFLMLRAFIPPDTADVSRIIKNGELNRMKIIIYKHISEIRNHSCQTKSCTKVDRFDSSYLSPIFELNFIYYFDIKKPMKSSKIKLSSSCYNL